MIYRIFPQKDTFITNYRRRNVPQTSSNVGASEILQLFKIAPLTSSQSASLSRILMQFDLSEFTALSASSEAPLSGTRFTLKLTNARHAETLPFSYDVAISPLSQSWDEGRGHDLDNFSDRGYANWDKRTSTTFWTTPGSTVVAPSVSQHFDDGYENLNVEITSIVNMWLSGGLTNNGLQIRLSGAFETDNEDYYVKMFHSRQTHFLDRRPYIEAYWDDSVQTGSVSLATGSGLFFVTVQNLKNQYAQDESPIFRLFIRDKDYNPAVVLTGSSSANGLAVANAYYKITNDRTDEVVVPFGTGSVKTTKLSYDVNGNYFKFYMNALSPREVYRIVFLFDTGNQRQIIDNDFKFRIV